MPAIQIYPQDGAPWLGWEEVERRVRTCFTQVQLDRERGRALTQELLRKLESFEDAPPESVQKLRAALDLAVEVTAWNDDCQPENGVQFLWRPEDDIYLWYAKGYRRQASKLRKALGYQFDDV